MPTLSADKSTHASVPVVNKALTQMNLQLHHVINDLTGVTGLAIVDAILAGERNAMTLAKLRDPRIKAERRPSGNRWWATGAASTCLR